MWRVLPFVVAWIVALVAGTGAAEARRTCPGMDEVFEVGLELRSVPVVYSNDMTTAEIDRIGSGLHRSQAGFKTTGLTVADLSYGMRMQYWQVAYGTNMICLYPHTIDITMGYRSTTVYIARQYAADSCQHRVVLEHEREHVTINEQVLAEHAPRIRAAVQKAVMRVFPIASQSGKRAQAEARSRLEAALQEAVQVMITDRDRRHAALDTPDSYRRAQNRCSSW